MGYIKFPIFVYLYNNISQETCFKSIQNRNLKNANDKKKCYMSPGIINNKIKTCFDQISIRILFFLNVNLALPNLLNIKTFPLFNSFVAFHPKKIKINFSFRPLLSNYTLMS